MDSSQVEVLRQCRLELVEDLEPRLVLDCLLEDGTITENDAEIISNAPSRRERCQLLLSMLPRRGPSAYGSFQKSLRETAYHHLDRLLTDAERPSDETVVKGGTDEGETHECDTLKAQVLGGECLACSEFLKELPVAGQLTGVLRKHCCLLLNNLEPIDVIDQCYRDQLLGDDECEKIRSGKTRKERCWILFRQLCEVDDKNPVLVLKEAMRRKYGFLVDALERDSEQDTNVKVLAIEPGTSCLHRELENDTVDDDLVDTTVIQNGVSIKEPPNGSKEPKTVRCTDESRNNGDGSEEQILTQEDNTLTQFSFTEDQVDCGPLQSSHLPTTPGEDAVAAPSTQHTDILMSEVGSTSTCNLLAVRPGGVDTSDLPSRRLSVAFNFLSTLINQGDFTRFACLSSRLKHRFPTDYDMMCILGYLNASRDLFQTDFDSAKKHINSALQIVPKTSNPRYFTVELFTAKSRMYITQKKLEKLQSTIDDAMMVIETDPVGCSGRAAGWLYVNDARNKTALMDVLTFRNQSSYDLYEKMHARARTLFQKALTNFQRDGGKDGPFGFGYTICRLVVLLMRCGNNGLSMNSLCPPQEDITQTETYLKRLEDSDIPIPKILAMHLSLAKSDYQFRRNNFTRAFEHAQNAYDLTRELNMLEFTEHAHNRVTFLGSRTTPMVEEIEEEEVNNILFGDSSPGNSSTDMDSGAD